MSFKIFKVSKILFIKFNKIIQWEFQIVKNYPYVFFIMQMLYKYMNSI